MEEKSVSSSSGTSDNREYFIWSNNNPYVAWNLYFFDEKYQESSDTIKKIRAIQEFLTRHKSSVSLTIENGLILDLHFLLRDKDFLNKWPTFLKDLRQNPKHTLACIKFVTYQTFQESEKKGVNSLDLQTCVKNIKLKNYGPLTPLQDIKETFHGLLISVRGYVTRISGNKLVSSWLLFSCTQCYVQMRVRQSNSAHNKPKVCNICGNRKFTQTYSLCAPNKFISIIKLQEWNGVTQFDLVEKKIDVELSDNLRNSCVPGDIVTITGIVNVKKSKEKCKQNSTYLEAVSVANNTNNKEFWDLYESNFVPNLSAIEEIRNYNNVFQLLVHSFCPDLPGQEMVKAALLLSLFGGTEVEDFSYENIHVLFITNPGFPKRKILQSCASLAPKGIYFCGNSGLTSSIIKEKGYESPIIEGGALALSNESLCCIDELETMPQQFQALSSAIRRNYVSLINFRGSACFPCKTSIIASIKPISGRYNDAKTILENLNIGQSLLSQFDLVFVIFDCQDQERDEILCDHIMNTRANLNNSIKSNSSLVNSSQFNSPVIKLKQKLMMFTKEVINVLPLELFKMYIAYAKRYYKPKLTAAAIEKLKNYIKTHTESTQTIKLSVSSLKTLIKLTAARAKLELRIEATVEDAQDAIEIYKFMRSTIFDDRTLKNIIRKSTSKKITKMKVQSFMNLLKVKKDTLGKSIFSLTDLKEIATKENIIINDFKEFILKLNEEGYLILIGPQTYKVYI